MVKASPKSAPAARTARLAAQRPMPTPRMPVWGCGVVCRNRAVEADRWWGLYVMGMWLLLL